MKKIKTCTICGHSVPRSLAYQAEVEYLAPNPLTGERSFRTLRGYICPICNQKCGYKTSKIKLKKYSFWGKEK